MPIENQNHIEKLVLAFQNGNENGFDFLFRQYYIPLSYFANKLLEDEEEAKDIVQDCFAKLWNNNFTIENTEAIKSYLYTTVKNACLNFLRNKKVSVRNNNEASYINDKADDNWLDKVTQAEIISEIFTSINLLPSRMQEVLRKSIFEGKDCKEIATELHTSPSTVRKQKARALYLLKSNFKKIASFFILMGIALLPYYFILILIISTS